MKKSNIIHLVAYGLLVLALVLTFAQYSFTLTQNKKLIDIVNKKAEVYTISTEIEQTLAGMYDACSVQDQSYDYVGEFENYKDLISRSDNIMSEVNTLQSDK